MGSAPTKRGRPAKKPQKPRKHTPKASDLEIELRLRSIEDRLKMGLSPAEVVAELTSSHFPHCNQANRDGHVMRCLRHLSITERQAQNYMARVTERLRATSTEHRAVLKDQILAMQMRCYQGAFHRGDFGEASRIAARIADLEGFRQQQQPMPNLLAFLQNVTTDRDRFPDRNYQLQVLVRDLLAEQASKGDRRALDLLLKLSAGIMDRYGLDAAQKLAELPPDLLDSLRSQLVSNEKFGGPLTPIERQDDFAALEVKQEKDAKR